MPTTKLDQRTLASLPGPAEGQSEVFHWDAGLPGLGIRVLASGSRSWVVRFRIGKQQRMPAIAKVAALTLKGARKQAGEMLAKAKLGQDARLEIQEAREQASDTFGKLAESYVESALEGRNRSTGYIRDTRRYLTHANYAKPLHDLPVAKVTRKRIASLLEEIRTRAPVAADQCRVALSGMFSWAMKQGYVRENPAEAVARLVERKARERVLSAQELRAVWEATEGPGDHNWVVRLLMLTGQRANEVAGMTWGEIGSWEAGEALWSLASARTKNDRPHDVPLSGAALALLESIPERKDRQLVFGTRKGGFSGWSKAKAQLDGRIAEARAKAAGREKPGPKDALAAWVIHDIRRSVVTHMNEHGIAQPHIIEAVVNHASGHKAAVAGVYNRANYAVEKRAALDRWAAWLMEAVGVAKGAPGGAGAGVESEQDAGAPEGLVTVVPFKRPGRTAA